MRKSLQKIWALILSTVVLIATLSVMPMVAHAADESIWDGSTDISWYDPDTAEFELTNAAQLAGLSELANHDTDPVNFEGQTIKLACDINLGGRDWAPIGSKADFAGTFDGGEHTVKNISLANSSENYVGFFHTVNEGTIKGLTLDAVSAGNSKIIVGGLIAMSANATIENCHVLNANLTASYYAGGMSAYHAGGFLRVKNCSVSNCTFSGNAAAGVVAFPLDTVFAENVIIKDTTITGTTAAGGIIGYDYSANGCNIKHSEIYADISAGSYAGGVVGIEYRKANNNINNRALIEDCTTGGSIKGTGDGSYIGGIVGYDNTPYMYNNISVLNCTSYCEVLLDGFGEAGGIYGLMSSRGINFNYADTIDYCDFFGTVNSNITRGVINAQARIGGVIGDTHGKVVNSSNFGNVTVNSVYSGVVTAGVAASTHPGPARIMNSYNSGDVTSDYEDTGALIGYHGMSRSSPGEEDNYAFDNGYNVGNLTFNNGKDNETSAPSYILGLLFWGKLTHAYWLKSDDTVPYENIATYENTAQEPYVYESIGSFRGSGLDITNTDSSQIYEATIHDEGKPFDVIGETATNKTLLDTLNEVSDAEDTYLHWVVYPDDDSAESVTDEPAIPGKAAAFAKVRSYRYPMLAHTSTVRYASEEDAEMGSPVIISAAFDNDDTKVYDAAYRTVVVDPRPEGSNTVKSVTVTDGYGREVEVRDNGDGTYSYTMPRTDAIVTVAYENGFEFLDKVTLTKTYLNKENYSNAGQILNPQGVLAENITFNITSHAAFNREVGRLSTPVPEFSEPSYTISAGVGTDLVDVTLPDYTEAGIGDYWYKVTETAGSTAGVTYDANTYYMHIVVSREGRNHGVSQITLHKTAPSSDGTYTNNTDDKAAGFTNTFGSGSLTVTKEIVGNFADRDKTFEITVTLTAPEDKTVTGPITYGANNTIDGGWTGSQEIVLTLGKGDSVTFTNIPDGVTYTVKEEDYSSEGYDNPQYVFDNDSETDDIILSGTAWAASYASGTITDSADMVTVTNSKNATIDVGVILENAPFAIIILMVIGLAVFMLINRRRRVIL